MEGTGQLNFGFSADFTANLSLNPGLQCNGIFSCKFSIRSYLILSPLSISEKSKKTEETRMINTCRFFKVSY